MVGGGILVVVAAAVTAATALSGRGTPAPIATHRAPAQTPAGTAPAASVTTTSAPSGRPGAVGMTTMAFVESSAGGARTLPTTVRYPATPSGGADRAGGPYPLIVFSQGYDVTADTYDALLAYWAAAGFVVADPTYPHTSPGASGGVDETDILRHPADLGYVIAQLVAASSDPASPLYRMIDPGAIGIAGHSDGGDVSLAVAADSCCRVGAVRAAAVLSGAELNSFGGRYYASPSPPLLVTQGSADTINVPACSTELYNAAPTPKWYLDLIGAGHQAPYFTVDPYEEAVARVTTDFFDLYLRHDAAGADRMVADGTVTGVASLTGAPSVPDAPGYCPGA